MRILPYVEETSPLLLRWRVLAFKLRQLDLRGGWYQLQYQRAITGLGRLDCSLRACDEELPDYLKCTEEPDPGVTDDYFYLADLWVMGAYEVTRTLHQQLCSQGGPAQNEVQELKQSLARVRMPIAKFEPTGEKGVHTNPRTGSSPNAGKKWVLDDKTVVSRNAVADEMLALSEHFRENELTKSLTSGVDNRKRKA